MAFLSHLYYAFSVGLEPTNLVYCLIGVVWGTLIGVLPGLGPAAGIALLLPLTFHIPPVAGIIMLSGIYYGAMYGGSTTAILINIPGDAQSVMTCADGYQMARQGRAGAALGIAAFGSFIAGTLGVAAVMLIGPPLATFALRFGPPQYFALMLFGLTILVYLARGSMLKALIMGCVGLIAGTVGTDIISGAERFTFGTYTLQDGLGIVPVVMGLFGIGEVLVNVEQRLTQHELYQTRIKGLLPNLTDWRASIFPILRGTGIGFLLGILPGGGAILGSFAAYAAEKKMSAHPEKFGAGAIEGVAAPESANNAASQGAFIPLLTLGIPANAVMAILLGALLTYGITPGPLLMTKHPEMFWGVLGSMYIGNVILLALNLPLIGIWVKILKIPYHFLFPLITVLCLVGVYTINSNYVEIIVMAVFGVLGYLMRKFDYEPAPFVLALVLSPMMEDSLRQSLLMSHGSPGIFFSGWICRILMICTILLLASPLIPGLKARPRGGEES